MAGAKGLSRHVVWERMKLVDEIDKGGAVMVCKYCGGEVQKEPFANIWRAKATAYVCKTCRGVQ